MRFTRDSPAPPRRRHGSTKGLDDPVDIVQHIVVPETQHAIALRRQPSIARRIGATSMLPAIDFDDQAGEGAI